METVACPFITLSCVWVYKLCEVTRKFKILKRGLQREKATEKGPLMWEKDKANSLYIFCVGL